jgi:hypothetical protein
VARMRRLSMWRRLPLWRVPLRVRLARLRWLWLRRLRLLLAMGALPHLLSSLLKSPAIKKLQPPFGGWSLASCVQPELGERLMLLQR